MYEVKNHPAASNTMTKLVFLGVCSGFLLMFLAVWLSNSGYKTLAGVSAALFVGCIIGVLIKAMFIVKRPKCPVCGDVCTPSKEEVTQSWLASCDSCKVTWRLGIGSRTQGGGM